MAVLRRIGDDLAADDATGAAAIVDDDLLAEPLAEMLGDYAGDNVVDAAGRERHDEPHRPVRVILRQGGAWEQQQERAADRCEQSACACHEPLPDSSTMRGARAYFNALPLPARHECRTSAGRRPW